MSAFQNEVVLSFQNLNHSFGGHRVLDGISAQLRQGDIVLLRGENGSGKTTLLNILTGNIEPDAGKIDISTEKHSETFQFPRSWWKSQLPWDSFTPEKVASSGIGRSWQDVRLFPKHTLRENIAIASPGQIGENPFAAVFSPLKARRQEKCKMEAADNLIAKLGLEGRENSYGDKISLGQSKRIAIARAVHSNVSVLFLDEPLAGLDAKGIREITTFLKQLHSERNLTIVIIEHVFNIHHLMNMATTIWTLDDGSLSVENMNNSHIESADTSGTAISGCPAWVRKIADRENAQLRQMELPRQAVLHFIGPDTSDINGDTPELEVNNLVVHRGRCPVINGAVEADSAKGLSFSLKRGELAILEAPNGWGKTTLMEAIAGLLPVESGKILLHGTPIQRLPVWERMRAGLSFAPSNSMDLSQLTCSEALRISGIRQIPAEIVAFKSRKVDSLSGGELRKLTLASRLTRPLFSVIMLDEPFSALDAVSIQRLEIRISELMKERAVFIAVPKIS